MLHVELTYDQWHEQFKPVHDSNGDMVKFGWSTVEDQEEIKKALNQNALWTILDCDGVQVISNGYHVVNRMDYVICDVAYGDESSYDVVDQEDVDAEDFLDAVNAIMEERYDIDPEEEIFFDKIEDAKWDGIAPKDFALQLGEKYELTNIND